MDNAKECFFELCENAGDLMQSVTPHGRFLYVNGVWLERLGYRRNEVERLALFDVIAPESRAGWEALIERLAASQSAQHVELVFRAKDGRRLEVEGLVGCQLEGGRPAAINGVFRVKQVAEREVEQLERLFQLSLDLLCVAGTDGYFKQINPAFERILGYSREELLSRSFIEFVHPEDRASTLVEVERLAQGMPVLDFQNRYRARDGSYRWLAWCSAPAPAHGLIYAVARDITEQKRNEQIMARQAAELARSNADLEQFAYAASHDLRAPLNAIANLAEWIEGDMPAELPAEVRANLEKLRNQVRRMEQLTDGLLRYAQAGVGTEEISLVDTRKLVRDLTILLSPPETLLITCGDSMPVFETARSPLEQVFRNLIGNAIKHHDRSEGRIRVSSVIRGSFYEFSVADDGPGIPEDFRDQLFKMFQKLRPRDEVEGTGIGLALVKRIVESQGGRVWLDTTQARGSTFRFTWPRRTEQP